MEDNVKYIYYKVDLVEGMTKSGMPNYSKKYLEMCLEEGYTDADLIHTMQEDGEWLKKGPFENFTFEKERNFIRVFDQGEYVAHLIRLN